MRTGPFPFSLNTITFPIYPGLCASYGRRANLSIHTFIVPECSHIRPQRTQPEKMWKIKHCGPKTRLMGNIAILRSQFIRFNISILRCRQYTCARQALGTYDQEKGKTHAKLENSCKTHVELANACKANLKLRNTCKNTRN